MSQCDSCYRQAPGVVSIRAGLLASQRSMPSTRATIQLISSVPRACPVERDWQQAVLARVWQPTLMPRGQDLTTALVGAMAAVDEVFHTKIRHPTIEPSNTNDKLWRWTNRCKHENTGTRCRRAPHFASGSAGQASCSGRDHTSCQQTAEGGHWDHR